ncbi:TIGR03364 family FAD-dependent oxidoreductase [Reichenbachiella agariperforans]|uniref:TIGR03364 family FAD-dependent oxidoreductase n=1 Tax=Reichenbachiella agariperforans TaxID=156994 RepID=UPI001C09E6A4|nr:TIGR03364 family FAD-dependent oxidoreductase [Reichenbachiella agariperforans]MBU2912930.1 TIGR03364 family FAD-dependent oxidoreductase [Reichenbachiella agariperforans]
MSTMKYDLIVVGGGILGTFHAYHALMAGKTVAMIERDYEPMSATVRNFGQVVPSGMDAKWQKHGRRSLEIYKDIQAKTDISIRQNGSIYIASDEEEMTLIHELHQINQVNGYASQLKSPAECLETYQGLKADYVKGGLFFPDEVTVEPRVAVHQIRAYLIEQYGLQYLSNRCVTEIESASDNQWVFCNSGEVFMSEKVVVCTGSDFKNLYPKLYQESDLEVTKLQMMQTVPQRNQFIPGSVLTGLSIRRYESFSECNSYAAIKAKEDPQSKHKEWGIHILFKQAMDGSVIIGDSHEYADAAQADMLGFDINQEMNQYMIQLAKEIFDLESWELQRTWFGVYSQCKNKDVFEHTIDQHIHIVTGIGGKGMTGSAGFAEESIRRIFGE